MRRKAVMRGVQIGRVPASLFPEYRLQQIFDGYKWDYQSSEQPTISDEVVLLDDNNANFLIEASERLYAETVALETEIRKSKALLTELGFSDKLVELLYTSNYQPDKHVRLMRFDFHPTTTGWKVSEVNSDVPAGFQEASLHPLFAAPHFPGYQPLEHFAESLHGELSSRLVNPATVAYLYDSHTVEDSQLLRFLGNHLAGHGFGQMHVEPNQLNWHGNQVQDADAIVRHYPAEWLEYLPSTALEAYFNSETVSANHPVAVIAQSKRLPLIWDKTDVEPKTWKTLLPPTKAVTKVKARNWIYKPAFGRVGEGINVPGTISIQEDKLINNTAQQNKGQWIQQKLFKSIPVDGLHLAVGAFVIEGKFAGCFARASSRPIMNFTAKELPVLRRQNV